MQLSHFSPRAFTGVWVVCFELDGETLRRVPKRGVATASERPRKLKRRH